jgi:hypothetical protein
MGFLVSLYVASRSWLLFPTTDGNTVSHQPLKSSVEHQNRYWPPTLIQKIERHRTPVIIYYFDNRASGAWAGLDAGKYSVLISGCALQAPAGSREGPSPLPN